MTTQPGTTAAAYLDEAMKAIALAKQALLGGAGAALFVSSGPDLAAAEASPGNPYGSSVPLASLRDREHYDAGSAAEGVERQWCLQPVPPGVSRISYLCSLGKDHDGDHVAGGSEEPGGDPLTWPQEPQGAGTCPVCESASRLLRGLYEDEDGLHPCVDPWHLGAGALHSRTFGELDGGAEPAEDACRDGMERDKPPHDWCWRAAGHPLPHRDAFGNEWDHLTPGLCPAQWGAPPETMLCSLASGHEGCHATAEGIEWAGKWETAEPHGGAR